ncbi:coiled-coil domain-containing protein 170-like [Watersipora subatra]|uniref:coiled-coil domain-containing protein 170-like n=1 Tax=Watersipora subatra TaxID=2589382 RepID=UPI00355BB20E
MSYLRSENHNGFPSINTNRGILAEPGIRRAGSLTRLDDIEASYPPTPRHVAFRPESPETGRSRSQRSSSPVRARSPQHRELSPTRSTRTISELQDQIRVLKEELHRKDSLIHSRPLNDIAADRVAVENARAEVAALQVKTENLVTKLREAELDNDNLNSRLRDLKASLDQSKENEARQVALVESHRERMREMEAAHGNLEMMKSRNEATVNQLSEEKRHVDEKVRDLEGRLRVYIQERESAEMKASSWEKRYQENLVILRSALGVDYNESVETMKVKIQEMVSENTMLKGRLCTLQEALSNSELESKASRETINRLVAEVNNEQSMAGKFKQELEHLNRERESAEIGRKEAERECEALRERLDSSQRAWSATKRELEDKTRVYSSLDNELRDNSHRAKTLQGRIDMFIEELACMLNVSPSQDLIMDRIRQIQGCTKDGQNTVLALEEKIRGLDEQLRTMYNQRQAAEQNARRMEIDCRDMEERVRKSEREITNGDVYRDGLRSDKEKYLRFMERMAEIMKMDRISAEVGFDMNGDALLARANQLAKLEADALADRNTHIYNLQRKLKTMKEQLESKDLHLDLLRKKIGQVEERACGRTELEKERDGELVKVRRLEKTCDKYCKELEQARAQTVELKAQLLESTKFQVDNQDLVRHCEKLETKLGQLDKIRQKQAKKITSLKDEMNVSETGGEERMSKAEHAIQALSSELKTTKQLLEEMGQRERQLVDLRTVVARMLGLDVNTLAVPDYEIISRLEKLVQAHHAHTLTNWTMDHALGDMEDGLRSGYPDAKLYLGEPRTPPEMHTQMMRRDSGERRSRSPEKRGRSPEKRRTRSPSPTKIDTRKY